MIQTREPGSNEAFLIQKKNAYPLVIPFVILCVDDELIGLMAVVSSSRLLATTFYRR